ncbi:MAG: S8 family serine peptidase [Crocinitomicaceae bacterium]|nr:S8 family serine peptidase [Crocinitomicaceae bacterium]
MRFYHIVLIGLTALFSFNTTAQNDILFASGKHAPQHRVDDMSFATTDIIDGGYYRLIQFDELLNVEERKQLEADGVSLLYYIPRNAFFARIAEGASLTDLSAYGITSVEKIIPRFKLSKKLSAEIYPEWTLFGSDQIELSARYFKGLDQQTAFSSLTSIGAEIIETHGTNTIVCRLPIAKLSELYSLAAFYYFEELSAEGEPENLDGRTNHRSNTLATDYSTGVHYDGTGVTVMMLDDGFIGDHIDYQGRADQTNCSPCSTSDANNHGDHVAGTIMGAGNLNPRYRGMAFGADLLVYRYNVSTYDDVPALVAAQDLVITSASYSNGCNAGYTSLASDLDEQIRTMPSLIHVFSAGNNGTSACSGTDDYGAGPVWGNITGGHKAAKNVLCVGNLNTLDNINSSSSRGPAHDGRIKPDICGVGTNVISTISDYEYEAKTGTSMSCPGVAGTVTQLYHAYRDLNGGQNPSSALIKGAILNTGEDLGNPGPDFIYGWGRINGRRAYELIAQNNYELGSVDQGGSNAHTVNVPNGTTKLSIMVYWTDYEGSNNASIALVNDINMQVVDPSAGTYNPWVLDHTADANLLSLDAVPSIDNLNNMEQVTIDNPAAGIYTVNIDGFAIPEGPQEYYVLYSFERNDITLTYPIGGEGLNPGTSERIRWDAANDPSDFLLEYTEDNGSTWNTIATISANQLHSSWTVPNTLSGEAKVRVTRNGVSDESDATFSIINTPTNLEFAWACPDSMSFTWNSVPGATSYEVYMLGNKYMDSIGTSTVNNLTIPFLSTDENWFSVRAFGPNNARSERAVAIRKIPGQHNCTWSAPFAGMSTVCDSISSSSCGEFLNESVNTDASTTYMWYFPTGTPATSTDENPTACFTTSGWHHVSLVVTNAAGSDSMYFNDAIFVQGAMQLPYHEGFENMVTLNGQENWSVYNPDVNNTFEVTNTTSLSGAKCALLFNHAQGDGDIDELVSGPIDLSVLDPTDIMTITFKYAYRRKNSDSDDWLRLYVKDACDDGWTIRKTIHGQNLSDENQASPWTPFDSTDWTTVHVINILSNYFTGDFRFKFQFENGGGNNFYLDDINLYSGGPSDDVISGVTEQGVFDDLRLYPNPTDDELNIAFSLAANEPVYITIQDVRGQEVQSHALYGESGSNLVLMDTQALSSGMYFITLESASAKSTHQFVVK